MKGGTVQIVRQGSGCIPWNANGGFRLLTKVHRAGFGKLSRYMSGCIVSGEEGSFLLEEEEGEKWEFLTGGGSSRTVPFLARYPRLHSKFAIEKIQRSESDGLH